MMRGNRIVAGNVSLVLLIAFVFSFVLGVPAWTGVAEAAPTREEDNLEPGKSNVPTSSVTIDISGSGVTFDFVPATPDTFDDPVTLVVRLFNLNDTSQQLTFNNGQTAINGVYDSVYGQYSFQVYDLPSGYQLSVADLVYRLVYAGSVYSTIYLDLLLRPPQSSSSGTTTTPPPAGTTVVAPVDPGSETVVKDRKGNFEMTIPVGAIEVVPGSSVKVSVTELAKVEVERILKTAKAPAGVQAIGKAFEFKAEVTREGVTKPVTGFAKPVTFTLKLSADDLRGVSDPDKVGVFRLNDDGTLTFVGGRFVDGKLVLEIYGFSRYVLAEVNVTFDDLADHWAKGDVELMAAKYVARGLPDGRFDPDGGVTRAQFAAMLVRAMGLPRGRAPMPFSDVKVSDWHFNEVMTAVKAGIVQGMGDGTFLPDAPVTREQVAVMVARALRAKGKAAGLTGGDEAASALATFADRGRVSAWAADELALAVKAGIVRGRTATLLVPQAGASRAEAAVMIARFWRK